MGKGYTKEFQLQASKMVVDGGYTLAETSKRLGVSTWSLRRWVEGFRKSGVLPPKNEPVQSA